MFQEVSDIRTCCVACSINCVLSHSPWRLLWLRLWICVPGNSSAIPYFRESLEQWSYGEFRGFKKFFSCSSIVTLPKESKKTNYTFLVISMSLTLESVALCVTCQACRKQNKTNFFITTEGEMFDEDTADYHMWGWCILIIRGFISLCSTWFQYDDLLRFLEPNVSAWANDIDFGGYHESA